jgi:hypothetical protein
MVARIGNWKLVIKVWCLPPDTSEEVLRHLHQDIVEAAVQIKALNIKYESDMMTLFPSDMMEYGAGSEIYLEIRSRIPQVEVNRLKEFAERVFGIISATINPLVIDYDVFNFSGQVVASAS